MFRSWKIWLLLSLSLGLAPFYPEPHLLGKLRWIAGGAVGMGFLDWVDFVWHGFPIIGLVWSIIAKGKVQKAASQ
jgi:hypothetical protein